MPVTDTDVSHTAASLRIAIMEIRDQLRKLQQTLNELADSVSWVVEELDATLYALPQQRKWQAKKD